MASKGSNGTVEQKNKPFEGMSRTLLADVSRKCKVSLPTQHPVVRWAIRHAAWLMERFQSGTDGLTPYYRQTRRNYSSTLVPFAENAVWREPGRHTLKLKSKWGFWDLAWKECELRFARGWHQERLHAGAQYQTVWAKKVATMCRSCSR